MIIKLEVTDHFADTLDSFTFTKIMVKSGVEKRDFSLSCSILIENWNR